MAVSNASGKMQEYVKKNFPDSKADLFAVFIERCGQFVGKNGYQAMITQHAWMFLSSFEKLRTKLQAVDTVNMAHLGARAFEEIGGEVVQTTSFVMRKSHTKGYKGTYCRLIEPNTQQGKKEMFLAGENRHVAQQDNFSKIPGSPVAYWLKENFFSIFESVPKLSIYMSFCKGLATMDNGRFLRFWHEVCNNNSCYDAPDAEFATESKCKWFAYNKGGEFRRWYGNRFYVINWANNGKELKDNVIRCYNGGSYTKEVRNEDKYFREGITWSTLSSGNISIRYSPIGCIFDSKGSMGFAKDSSLIYLISAFLNSVVTQKFLEVLSPTLDYNIRGLNDLPFLMPQNNMCKELCRASISLQNRLGLLRDLLGFHPAPADAGSVHRGGSVCRLGIRVQWPF